MYAGEHQGRQIKPLNILCCSSRFVLLQFESTSNSEFQILFLFFSLSIEMPIGRRKLKAKIQGVVCKPYKPKFNKFLISMNYSEWYDIKPQIETCMICIHHLFYDQQMYIIIIESNIQIKRKIFQKCNVRVILLKTNLYNA